VQLPAVGHDSVVMSVGPPLVSAARPGTGIAFLQAKRTSFTTNASLAPRQRDAQMCRDSALPRLVPRWPPTLEYR
jgi:hypothetical protein